MTSIPSVLTRCAAGLLLAAAAAMPAHALIIADPAPTNPYVEMGDAPGLPDAQAVTGGPFDGFTGMIGDPDLADAFAFSILTGGSYIFEGAFVPPIQDTEGNFGVIVLTLFTAGGTELVSGISAIEVVLTPGNYLLELTTDFLLDPPYAVEVSGPVGLPITALTVPEPGTLALFGLGLAGLGFARRRKSV